MPNEKGEAAGHSPKPKGYEAIPARLDPLDTIQGLLQTW